MWSRIGGIQPNSGIRRVIKAVIPRKLIVIRQLGAVTVAQGPVFIDIAKGVIHSHVAINRRANVAVSLHKPTILYKFVY